MVWLPQSNAGLCRVNPSQSACQPEALAFMAFLVQYLGNSYDKYYTDSSNFTKTKPNIEIDNESYDFIIVGAGAAGCVLANRLSEIKKWKILLLEAGDEEPIIADIPAMYHTLMHSNIDYAYQTQPERFACAQNEHKSCYWPRGKVMGGSSSINGLYYARGSRHDYDGWAALGNPGWGYEDILPYFKKLEDFNINNIKKDPDSHGEGGYVRIEYSPFEDKNYRTYIEAWKELGYEEKDYITGGNMIGVARLQHFIIHGARQSANGAYIRPIRGRRENLTIKINSHVTKIIIDPRTKRAIGVEYTSGKNNKIKKVYAKKEVLISAGAIESPKLLMLSGIGPTAELQKANIRVLKDAPVGQNLYDHINVITFIFNLDNKTSVLGNLEDVQNDIVYWMNTHEGILSSQGITDAVTYLQTQYENHTGVPDIQTTIGGSVIGKDYFPWGYYNQVSLITTLLNPKSRGVIKLNTTDPLGSPPLIYANYLAHPDDIKITIAGMKLLKKMFTTKAFKEKGWQEKPLDDCKQFVYDSQDYYHCVLQRHVGSGYHPVGTCKMGPNSDREAVVDSKLKVYGIQRLRVIDAAIMPRIPRGNTYVPVLMIAEKASDIIKKKYLKN